MRRRYYRSRKRIKRRSRSHRRVDRMPIRHKWQRSYGKFRGKLHSILKRRFR